MGSKGLFFVDNAAHVAPPFKIGVILIWTQCPLKGSPTSLAPSDDSLEFTIAVLPYVASEH